VSRSLGNEVTTVYIVFLAYAKKEVKQILSLNYYDLAYTSSNIGW